MANAAINWSISADDLVTITAPGVRVVCQYADGVLHDYKGRCPAEVRERVEAAMRATDKSAGVCAL